MISFSKAWTLMIKLKCTKAFLISEWMISSSSSKVSSNSLPALNNTCNKQKNSSTNSSQKAKLSALTPTTFSWKASVLTKSFHYLMAKSHKISKPSTMNAQAFSKWNRPTKRTPIVLLIGAQKVNTTKDNYSLDSAVLIFRLEKTLSLINKFSWNPKIKQESQLIKNKGFRFLTVIKYCKRIRKLAKKKNVHF